MADLHGTSLTLVDTFTDNGTSLMDGPYQGAFATINGSTFLYIPAQNDDGITIFSVAGDGTLTYLSSVADTAGTTLNFAGDIVTFEVNGNPFLAVSGITDDGVTVYALSDTPGYLTFTDAVFDTENASFELDAAWRVQAYEGSGGTFLYVGGQADAGFSVFEISDTGAITNLQNLADDAIVHLVSPHLSEVYFSSGGQARMVVGSSSDAGFTVYNLNSTTGLATYHADYDDPVQNTGTYQPSAVHIGGTDYIYVPNDVYNSISVYALTSGTVELIQKIRSPVALDRAAEGHIAQIGDTLVYTIGAFNSDQVHVYTIDSKAASGTAGQLTLIQSEVDGENGNLLTFPRVSDSVTIDGRTFLAVGATDGDAVSIYEIGGGDDVLDGTQQADTLTGGGGDDVLYGRGGDDVIDGGADTDVIYAGSGLDTVMASEGTDRSYGGSNFDTFDATNFSGASAGVQIDTAFNLFRLPDGTKQFIADFEKLIGTAQDDDLRGDDANNDLRGYDGDDVLNGRGGNDSLRGSTGNDRLLGVDGDDFLFGGTGNDDLRGGRGNDTLMGENGDDYMLGENGTDLINGGRGDDVMFGGGGLDTFVFDAYALAATEYDTIRDFTNGSDKIDLSAFGFANIGAVLAGASQKAWGVRMQFDADQVLSLEGVLLTDLDASDFIL